MQIFLKSNVSFKKYDIFVRRTWCKFPVNVYELEQDLNTLEFSSHGAHSMWNESFQFILFDRSVKTPAEQILSWIGPSQWTLRKTIHIYLGYATLYSSGVRWYIWLYPVWLYDWQGHYLAVSLWMLTTWRVPCPQKWRNLGRGFVKFQLTYYSMGPQGVTKTLGW